MWLEQISIPLCASQESSQELILLFLPWFSCHTVSPKTYQHHGSSFLTTCQYFRVLYFDLFTLSMFKGPPYTKMLQTNTITKMEALAMVYALYNYCHHLLGKMFVVFVDHMAFIYLVNNPQVSNRVFRWLLLFQKYDLSVVYKLGKIHSIVDILSYSQLGEATIGIRDYTLDVALFTISQETIAQQFLDQLDWINVVFQYLTNLASLLTCQLTIVSKLH